MTDTTKNPYRSPASGDLAADLTRRAQRNLRLVLVVSIYVLAIATGILKALRPEHPVSSFVLPLAMCSATTCWCVVDSRLRRSPIVQSVHWIIFFTWPLAVPVYLAWSRRLWGMGLALVNAVCIFGTFVMAYHATGYAAFGAAWFTRLLVPR